MDDLEKALINVISEVAAEAGLGDLSASLTAEQDLMDTFDSMDLVNVVLRSEELLEAHLGVYVALADGSTFDYSSSPFRSLDNWITFVSRKAQNCG